MFTLLVYIIHSLAAKLAISIAYVAVLDKKKTPFIVCGFVQGPGWVLLKSAHSIKNMCHFYTHRNQAHAIFEYHRCIVHTIKIPYETIRRYMRYDMALIICMSLPGKIIIAFRVTYYGVRRLVYC